MGKIQVRRDLASNWASINPIPANGELCYEYDTGVVKIGDGSTHYVSLPVLLTNNYSVWKSAKDPAFGIKSDGTSQSVSLFNAAVLSARSAGAALVFPGGTYKFTGSSSIELSAAQDSIIGLGHVILDFSACTAAQAIHITGVGTNGLADTFHHNGVIHGIKNVKIIGPDTDAATIDGIVFDDTTDLDFFPLEDVEIFGFRDGEVVNNNTWLIHHRNVQVSHCHRYGVNWTTGTNAGENMHWIGGGIIGCTNASGTAIALYIGAYPVNAIDANFFGVSFDYNDIQAEIHGGTVSLIGCHIENNISNNGGAAMFKLYYAGPNPVTTLNITNGTLDPSDTIPARDHLIEMTGNECHVSLTNVKCVTFGRKTDIVKRLSGTGTVTRVGGTLEISTEPAITRWGSPFNVLTNSGFETGDLTGWLANGGGLTYTVQTTTKNSGTYALKLAGTGVTTTSWPYQRIPVVPNTKVIFTAEMAADTMTGGSVTPTLRFYGHDDSFLSQVSCGAGISANQGFTRFGGFTTVPDGAAYVEVMIYAQNLNGNVYIDDVYFDQQISVGGKASTVGTTTGTVAAGNDARLMLAAAPPKTGQWQPPSNMAGTTATALSGTSGQGTFCYFDVVKTVTISALGVFLSVAAVGGTSLELRLGLFADDGSWSYPGALIVDGGAASLTGATGQVAGSAISQSLAPGRYWVGAKWTFSVVPSTLPQLLFINSASPPLPGANVGNNRGYPVTGLTSGAWTGSAPAGMFVSGATTIICAGIKAA